ncbi:SDR family NAD(P)-dependent oxidoreductase [Kutzneria sp. NPDC052558]|uniref:type I polyketide synthase n=1 Tax=Kutzneria sp. NPDC052558 TaxID=3364121 RepID=UPI0037CCB355
MTEHGLEPIAIVGMAARVPGAADVNQFWRNLVDGVESVTFMTREEQLAAGVPEANLADPNWVPAAAMVDKVDRFDAGLFGMSAREAEIADPQNRLFLEAAHTALEDAGHDPARFDGAIGVYGGTGVPNYEWRNLRGNAKLWPALAGNLMVSSWNYPDYVATMVSYKLGLTGPSLTVHTACSTSLVAVHLAAEALRQGECDMALAGGVCVELPHGWGYAGLAGLNSTDGHCRPFDARADGTLWSSGVGVVALRRLSDALADGDHVRAVILGNAINNDGSDKVGFSAPSVQGQVACVAQALAVADVDPRTVGYVEAHGTGTALGDPIEVAALTAAYGDGVPDRQWCGIGSVKSNIGHLSQAAGVVGLIKTALALEHRLIPPSINFESINPEIDIEASPFYVAGTLSKWDANGTPRRAAVSSFGFGGTNAHVILEEAPAPERPRPTSNQPAYLLPVSAQSEAALADSVEQLARHLDHHPDADLADVAHTLWTGRAVREHRAFVVAADSESAAEALRDKKVRTGQGNGRHRVAFLFTGQGGQYAGMAAELHRTEPVFAATVDHCAAVLEPLLGLDIRTLMFGTDGDTLGQTRYTQPALFVLEYALATLWRDRGVEPAAMIGHSIGELVAATVAGVFELSDALRLVATRGRLMQSMPAGAMLAVQLDESEMAGRLAGAGCAVATVNAPGTCVVAGPPDAVAAIAEDLAAQGISCRRLRTSHAFHSPMMEPILDEFMVAVEAVPRRAPRLPFLSNLTGGWITEEQARDAAYWADQLRQPVRFGDCVSTLLADGDWAVIECGPGRTLAGLVRQRLPRSAMAPLASLPGPTERTGDLATLYGTVGELWLAGLPVQPFGPPGRRTPLPTYPYQRDRHWIDADPVGAAPMPTADVDQPFEQWFKVPVWRQLPAATGQFGFDDDCLVFVAGARGASLAEAMRADGVAVTEVRPSDLATKADYDRLVADGVPSRIVHAWALDADPAADAWPAQETGFFSLLWLGQALAGRPAEVHMDIVSSGVEDVLGGDLTHPEQATVDGVARVLPLELTWVTVRRIDVHPDHTTTGELLGELRSPFDASLTDAWRTVALRAGRRWAVGHQPVPLPNGPEGVRTEGRYLITGGLGGVGLSIAEDLATRSRARVVLLSRSGLPPREDWDTQLSIHGPASHIGRAIAAIRRMEQAGGRVLVVAADVTDPADLGRVRARAVAEFGGLDGIVHAAGLPGGGVAELKDRAAVTAVLAPKLAGPPALKQAFGDLALDFVLLCSSTVAFAGGFGMVDYCAANAFLDAYARSDHGWPCRVLSVNWGGWLEVGMEVDGLGGAADRDAARLAVPVEHPILRRRSGLACWGRLTGGTMSADDHLAVVRAGAAECGLGTVDLSDVVFGPSLSIPDGGVAEYRVEFGESGGFIVTSRREGVRTEHARGGRVPRRDEPAAHTRGIRPEQGAEAFRRALTVDLGPQVVINTEALGDMLTRVRRPAVERLADAPVVEKPVAEPVSALAATLCGIWAETIGVERVFVDDDFFELGGNSLVAVQLIARISREAGVRLPMRTLFDTPTVGGLAARIEQLRAAEPAAPTPTAGITRLARRK